MTAVHPGDAPVELHPQGQPSTDVPSQGRADMQISLPIFWCINTQKKQIVFSLVSELVTVSAQGLAVLCLFISKIISESSAWHQHEGSDGALVHSEMTEP